MQSRETGAYRPFPETAQRPPCAVICPNEAEFHFIAAAGAEKAVVQTVFRKRAVVIPRSKPRQLRLSLFQTIFIFRKSALENLRIQTVSGAPLSVSFIAFPLMVESAPLFPHNYHLCPLSSCIMQNNPPPSMSGNSDRQWRRYSVRFPAADRVVGITIRCLLMAGVTSKPIGAMGCVNRF